MNHTREFSSGLSVPLEDVTVAGGSSCCWTHSGGFWGPIAPVCLCPSSVLLQKEGYGCISFRGRKELAVTLGDLSRLFACAVFLIFTLCFLLLSSKKDFALKHAKIFTSFSFLHLCMEASQTTKNPKDKSCKCVRCRKQVCSEKS